MRPSTFQAHRTARRALIGLTVMALAVSACGGSAGATTAPGGAATPDLAASAAPAATAAAATAAAATTPAPTVAVAPLQALDLLWQAAGPVTGKVATFGPAIDPISGNIWVAVPRLNQFWIISPDGKFLEAWGTPGKEPGQLHLASNDPSPDSNSGLAFAPDGSFYVADTGNYRVQKFDKDRKFVTTWGSFGSGDGQFGNPKGIATDGKTVWVADDPRGDVQSFDTNGKFLRAFPFPFVLFSRAPSGNLVVANPKGILELDGAGNTVAQVNVAWSDFNGGPSQVVADAAGHFYFGLQNDSGPVGLLELDATGAVLGHWSTGGETMALSPDGKSIYVAYSGPPDVGWPYIQKYALP